MLGSNWMQLEGEGSIFYQKRTQDEQGLNFGDWSAWSWKLKRREQYPFLWKPGAKAWHGVNMADYMVQPRGKFQRPGQQFSILIRFFLGNHAIRDFFFLNLFLRLINTKLGQNIRILSSLLIHICISENYTTTSF